MDSGAGPDRKANLRHLALIAVVSITAACSQSGSVGQNRGGATPSPSTAAAIEVCPRTAAVLERLLDAFNAGDIVGVKTSLAPDAQVSDDLPGARFDSIDQPSGTGAAYLLDRMAAGERFADITITPGTKPDVAGLVMTRSMAATKFYVRGKARTSKVYPDCVALSALIMTSNTTPN